MHSLEWLREFQEATLWLQNGKISRSLERLRFFPPCQLSATSLVKCKTVRVHEDLNASYMGWKWKVNLKESKDGSIQKKKKRLCTKQIKNSYQTNRTKIDKGQFICRKVQMSLYFLIEWCPLVYNKDQSYKVLGGQLVQHFLEGGTQVGWCMSLWCYDTWIDLLFSCYVFILMNVMKRAFIFWCFVLFCFLLFIIQSAFQLAPCSPYWGISHFVLSWGSLIICGRQRDQIFILSTPVPR